MNWWMSWLMMAKLLMENKPVHDWGGEWWWMIGTATELISQNDIMTNPSHGTRIWVPCVLVCHQRLGMLSLSWLLWELRCYEKLQSSHSPGEGLLFNFHDSGFGHRVTQPGLPRAWLMPLLTPKPASLRKVDMAVWVSSMSKNKNIQKSNGNSNLIKNLKTRSASTEERLDYVLKLIHINWITAVLIELLKGFTCTGKELLLMNPWAISETSHQKVIQHDLNHRENRHRRTTIKETSWKYHWNILKPLQRWERFQFFAVEQR